LIAQVKAAQENLIWEWYSRDASEDISWSGFVDKLRAIQTKKWCDLYLCTYIDKDRAIAAGIHIVDPVTEVYRALLPLYGASIQLTVQRVMAEAVGPEGKADADQAV
jgi:hypothetical protein